MAGCAALHPPYAADPRRGIAARLLFAASDFLLKSGQSIEPAEKTAE
jgi:hypothetical protein